MPAPETCRCCSVVSLLDQGICAVCARSYGPRVARLLGRCQADPDFVSTCLGQLREPMRSRFAAALSAKCLTPSRGPGLRYARSIASESGVKHRASA
ncbi:MAG: hypothetical protein ABI488_05580 [Polyangiaceae bacterium]